MCYNTSNVTTGDDGMITASFINLSNDISFTTNLLVEYVSGQMFTSNEVITSTVIM